LINVILQTTGRALLFNPDIKFYPSSHGKESLLWYNDHLYSYNRSKISGKENPHLVHYYYCYERIKYSFCSASITIHFANTELNEKNDVWSILVNDFHCCENPCDYKEIIHRRKHLYELKQDLPNRCNIQNLYHDYVKRNVIQNKDSVRVPAFSKIYKSLWFHHRKCMGIKNTPNTVHLFNENIHKLYNRYLNANQWDSTIVSQNLVLVSKNGINRLNDCDYIAVDGNHKAVCYFGKHHYIHDQLIIIYAVYIHAETSRCQGFPCVYILCNSHQAYDYEQCFKVVNQKLPNKKFVAAITDFEQAFTSSLPGSQLVKYHYGCLFHMNQAIYRKFPTSFAKKYSGDKMCVKFREQMEVLWIIPFVPIKYYRAAVLIFLKLLKQICVEKDIPDHDYMEFETYLKKTWYGSKDYPSMYPIAMWNCAQRIEYIHTFMERPMYMVPETSNNRLEATNRAINSQLGVKQNCLVWMERLCQLENETDFNYFMAMKDKGQYLKKKSDIIQKKEKEIYRMIQSMYALNIKVDPTMSFTDIEQNISFEKLDDLHDIMIEMAIIQIKNRRNYKYMRQFHTHDYQ